MTAMVACCKIRKIGFVQILPFHDPPPLVELGANLVNQDKYCIAVMEKLWYSWSFQIHGCRAQSGVVPFQGSPAGFPHTTLRASSKGIAGFDDGDEPVNFKQLAKQVRYLLTGSLPYFGKQVGWGTWPGIWGKGVSSRSTTTKVVILWELLFRVMWIVFSPCGLNVCYFTSSQPTLNFVFWRCQCNTGSPITSLEIPLPSRTSTPPPPVPFALCRAWPSYVCVSLKHGWGGSEGLGNLAESFHQQVLKSHHHGDKGGCHYHGHSLVHHHQLPPFRARSPYCWDEGLFEDHGEDVDSDRC